MRKTFLSGLSIIALATAAGAAAAQTPTQTPAAAHQRGEAGRDRTVTRAQFVDARVARLTELDANGDGSVSVEERQAAMQARRAERADARFAKLDANSDGSISRAEFDAGSAVRGERSAGAARMAHRGGNRHAMRVRGPARQAGPVVISDVAAKLGEQFDKLDANRDGVVTADERRAAMTAMRARFQERRAARQAERQTQQPASPAPASE